MTTLQAVVAALIDDGFRDAAPNMTLVELMDSLELVSMVTELEERFGVDILDDDMNKLITVSDVARYIDERKAFLDSGSK